jgi:isocitrate/isopropylmalate dehydrogenase
VTLDLATIPGDGVEPEVVEQALCALRTAAHAEGGAEVRVTEYPFGAGTTS